MNRPLADQRARDRIRDDLDTTLFVEASAGTGKTTALVGRIVQLVAGGKAGADRIAAITFTDAAGRELQDRVLVELERAAGDTGRSAEERERCRVALGLLDAAAIETLHSFATRILSMYPLEAGLPPGFEVVDEARAAAAFEERWAVHLEAMLDEPALREPLRRGLTLGLTVDDLHDLARSLHEDWDRLEEAAAELSPGGLSGVDVAPLAAELRGICAERQRCSPKTDGMLVRLEEVEQWLDQLESAAGDDLAALRLLSNRPSLRTGNVGRAPNWPPGTLAELRQSLLFVDERVHALLETARTEVIAPLYGSLRRFVLDGARERRRLGLLEFHDLLVLARDLLRDDREVRRALRERFSHLLIDEFQDTDPLQTEIAFLLGAGDDADHPSWRTAETDPGRLFFVGDPKQSIYGFRRADIDLYQSVQARFAASTERLTQNFRSVPAITEWVNATVAPLMGSEAGPGQAAYSPLHADRPEHPEAVTVHLLGGPRDRAVGAVRDEEAGAIARLLRGARDGRWQVREGSDGDGNERYRDARFQDVAILVPARTSLPSLLSALEETGIPYRLESKSLVYDTQEVRDLLSILRTIDDPSNEVALVAALRSPGFACGDDDLLSYIDAGGRWDYREPPPASLPAGHLVVAGMTWLRQAHARRWWQPVSTIVDRVIRERRLLELGVADRRPRERWQRLRFVLDQARAFMDAGGATLRAFLVWTQNQAEADTRVVETVVPDPDDDAVRIMTIHTAKGLEFPIVLLTGLNTQRSGTPGPVLWDDSGHPELRLRSGFATPGYEELKSREQEQRRFEDIRLLYVAMTRARDHLVVSVFHAARERGQASRAAKLYELAGRHPELWRPAAAPPGQAGGERRTKPAPSLDTAADRDSWLERRRELVAAYGALPSVSASALARELSADRDPNLEKESPAFDDEAPWRRGRAGTSIGRAVHSVLQTVDLATGEALAETAQAQATAEGVSARASEVERLARAALASDAVREAVASGRFWREVYVGATVGGVLVEGFVDLLYEGPDGYVVVDYKTDALPGDGDLDAAIRRYRPQGAAYALALSKALDRPVSRCLFLFLAPPGAREREIEDLDAAMNEVREVLAGVARTSHETDP